MKIYYSVETDPKNFNDYLCIKVSDHFTNREDLIHLHDYVIWCAENLFSEHDGYEYPWPQTITMWTLSETGERNILGSYNVEVGGTTGSLKCAHRA